MLTLYVGLSSLYLAPMLPLCSPMLAFQMLTPIAGTEKAEMGRGRERGGNRRRRKVQQKGKLEATEVNTGST